MRPVTAIGEAAAVADPDAPPFVDEHEARDEVTVVPPLFAGGVKITDAPLLTALPVTPVGASGTVLMTRTETVPT